MSKHTNKKIAISKSFRQKSSTQDYNKITAKCPVARLEDIEKAIEFLSNLFWTSDSFDKLSLDKSGKEFVIEPKDESARIRNKEARLFVKHLKKIARTMREEDRKSLPKNLTLF
jgi:hypothetical protein